MNSRSAWWPRRHSANVVVQLVGAQRAVFLRLLLAHLHVAGHVEFDLLAVVPFLAPHLGEHLLRVALGPDNQPIRLDVEDLDIARRRRHREDAAARDDDGPLARDEWDFFDVEGAGARNDADIARWRRRGHRCGWQRWQVGIGGALIATRRRPHRWRWRRWRERPGNAVGGTPALLARARVPADCRTVNAVPAAHRRQRRDHPPEERTLGRRGLLERRSLDRRRRRGRRLLRLQLLQTARYTGSFGCGS